jgi:hypothetical protein
MRRWLFMALLLCVLAVVIAAQRSYTLPAPYEVYRLIVIRDNDRAGDIEWLEVWERRDGQDTEWVMVEADSDMTGITTRCHYLLAMGSGTPLYMIDGEAQAVDGALTVIAETQQRRLMVNSDVHIRDVACDSTEDGLINGIPAERCTFADEDALNLFEMKPPATSQGDLWTALDGGYPLQYDFIAQGSTKSAEHTFSYQTLTEQITPPTDVSLMCFEDDFPLPSDATLLNSTLTFLSYETPLSRDELNSFYATQLDDWTIEDNRPNAGRVYETTLASGTTCQIQMRFGAGRDDNTIVATTVYPEDVNVENFRLPDTISEAIVVQDFLRRDQFEGTVREVAQRLIDEQGDDWTVRDDLTDIRDDSAFIAMSDGEQIAYITLDARSDGDTDGIIQTGTVGCGVD